MGNEKKRPRLSVSDQTKQNLSVQGSHLTDEDRKKEIDEIYSHMEVKIQERNELLWCYVPLLSKTYPKDIRPKKISQFYIEKGDINHEEIQNGGIVKCRVRGIGKRYFNLTAISPEKRLDVLEDIRAIHHPAPSQENRRLDALARLLEGTHICVAVYRKKDNTLLITANDINERTRKTTISEGALIADVMEHFTNQEKRNDLDKEIEIFNRMCLASVKSSDTSGIKISDATITRISDYIFNDKERNWKTLSVLNLLEIATGNPALTDPLESGDIMRAFFIISDLARDFRKVKDFFSKENFSFDILNFGEQNVHAELRMIDYLLKNQGINFINDTHYIGISKLCCAKCELVIKTMNFTMKEGVIETRGEHGIGADDKKWQAPHFLYKKGIKEFPKETQDYLNLLLHKYDVFSSSLQSPSKEKAEMYGKVLGILDLKEGNAINSLMKKYTFLDCIHQLMSKEGIPNPDRKIAGFYLYRQKSEVHVLVIQNKHTYETLNLTRLAKNNQQYKDILNKIEWTINRDTEVRLDDKLVELLVSSCKYPHFLNGSIMSIESVLSDRDLFLSDISIKFVSLNLNGKIQYLNIGSLRDIDSDLREIYRDLFIINDFLIKQEKKPVNQYASQSSSDEEMEIEITVSGILKKLDDIKNIFEKRKKNGLSITESIFWQEVWDVLKIKIVTLTENSSKDCKYCIELIESAKSKIRDLYTIDEKQLIEIMQTLYNACISSAPQINLDDAKSFETVDSNAKKTNTGQQAPCNLVARDSPLNTGSQSKEKEEEASQEQRGWNCFDIAVDLASKLENQNKDPDERAISARQKFVEYVLANKDDLRYRKLLAPEIRHAAALTVTYMIIQGSEDENEMRQALQLEEFFQLRDAIDPDDSYNQYLIHKNIEKLFENKSSLEFPRGSLPGIMRNDELKQIVLNYQNAHENIKPTVAQCNHLLGKPEGSYFSYEELAKYFAENTRQAQNLAAFNKFKEAHEIFSPCEEAFNNFCERADIYENYVTYYYGTPDEEGRYGWFSFQRTFSGEESTSMIDIAALFLEKRIIVKNSSGTVIHTSTQDFHEEVEVLYNGSNHFSAISNNSSGFSLSH